MRKWNVVRTSSLGLALAMMVAVPALAEPITFRGASDASAACALDAQRFVLADDETNVLQIYDTAQPPLPVGQLDLGAFLSVDGKQAEADIEGAARVGDCIYWITSHGRSRSGKERASRQAFFATDIVKAKDGTTTLVPHGRPYRRLVEDLLRDPQLAFLGFARSTGKDRSLTKQERADLAPTRHGLNIEGLAAAPDGSLLIGVRNPLYRDPVSGADLAMILVLRNPAALVDGGDVAEFGAPMLLDAGGQGLRSLEALTSDDGAPPFVVVTGPADGQSQCALHAWRGGASLLEGLALRAGTAAVPSDFTSEAVFQVPGTTAIWVLSDDGGLERSVAEDSACLPGELLKHGKCPNKFLVDRNQRTFRAVRLELGQ